MIGLDSKMAIIASNAPYKTNIVSSFADMLSFAGSYSV